MTMRALALLCALLMPGAALAAQQLPAHAPEALAAQDYARAERQLSEHTSPLVFGASVVPTWLEGGRFWYRNQIPGGSEIVLVDPATRTRARAFDHDALAGALTQATGGEVPPLDLPLSALELQREGGRAIFTRDGRRFECDLQSARCQAVDEAGPGGRPDEVVSPDGRRAVFIRGHDLWMRDLASGEETRLTEDGQEDFGYGTNNAGWVRSDRPVVRWSPDSRRIATFQHDGRGVGKMYLVSTRAGHPELDEWRYPLPEDTVIFRIHRLVIDVEGPDGPTVVRLRMPPDPHRSTVCDHVFCGGTFTDVEWSADGARLAFVSSSRDHKRATLRIADAVTGEVRDVLEERVPTFFESGYRGPNWRLLAGSGEAIWFSQKDDWGHLYLHDLATGREKGRITEGDWNVLQVLQVDSEARRLWLLGNEREEGDPYFQYLYSVGLDGSGLRLLTPERGNHEIRMSPDGRWFVDSWSTPDTPPVTVLRDREGRVVMELEKADVSRLVATGWQPPISFSVKARDGRTDLYGLLFRPTGFDPSRRYPVINYIYPGPQSGSVGSRSFASSRRDLQALAELGFVVVSLDAMGTPMRSKSFHEAYYGNMGDNGLPDQITGMEQLAERYPWIDLERAGIYGHSGGGYASTDAILRYPDFFKVAVSQAGNHDNRLYEDDWGEKWQGLLETHPDGTTSYDNQANQLLAGNLKGKLLIAHGTLDDNVPPLNTLVVVDALIAANKDFDLLMLPNRRHGFGNEPYMMRRRWDYFVRHLLGAEPPREYEFGRLEPPRS